jgi:hypothetical protein
MRDATPNQSPYLWWALALAFVYHGALLLSGSFRNTYDAYVHIFFADHYARAWFDHWEPRWYTGFSMTSYPPGSQQSIALLSHLVGLPNAFVLVATFAVLNCTLGTYRFSRLWVSEAAAGYAALLFVFASSIAETLHVFGQLPTLFSLGFLLNALPSVYRFISEGGARWLLSAWLLNAATTAGHHVTTLFGAAFFVAPVVVLALVGALRTPRPDEPPGHPGLISRHNLKPLALRRLRRLLPALLRTAIYGAGLIAALVVVVLPYWLWSKADPIAQVPIPHASRDSFIKNTSAGLVFWLLPYGLSVVTLPYVFYKGFTTKAWPLALSYALLALLGTGGTTPLPRMLLRGAFDILTLDRFTFWATICQLPLLGEFVASLCHGRLARYARGQLGLLTLRPAQVTLAVAYLSISGFVVNFTKFRRLQPDPIDCRPIVAFLEKDQHDRWRYLTLGLGDQMAWLSAQTTALSVDGNYHSARRLPELTTTPIERLEGAKYSGVPGIGSLQQFLTVPEKYNLKFVFSNDQFYDPLLFFSGWHRLERLDGGIMVWERGDIPPLPEVLPRKEIPYYQRIMWGTVPMAALVGGLATLSAPIWARYLRWLFDDSRLPSATGHHLRQRLRRALSWPLRRLGTLAQVRTVSSAVRARAMGLWLRLDERLRLASVLPAGDEGAAETWQIWLAWARWFPPPRPAPPTVHELRLAIALALGAVTAVSAYAIWHGHQRRPSTVIESYYDDLDFRRFRDAYEHFDPATRPSLEEYLLVLSAKGGIVASYGKLESVQTDISPQGENAATAVVRTRWLTSLLSHESSEVVELRRREGRWFLTPERQELKTPPSQFFRRPEVAWHSAGRRRVTTETTSFQDVLDRPELQVLSARLVARGGRYSVVGELVNVDVDPADVTVTGVLNDSAGRKLTQYNAQQIIMHKLLPKEVTPFRVDFEGVAGAFDQARFDADSYTPPELDGPVKSFQVYAKALVTSHDLNRNLAAQAVRVDRGGGNGLQIDGLLVNTGTLEATVPHVLVTYYDGDGRVTWVDHLFVRDAVRPQYTHSFSVPVTPRARVEVVAGDGLKFANNVDNGQPPRAWDHPDRFPMPAESGYASARLSVHYFVRSNQ